MKSHSGQVINNGTSLIHRMTRSHTVRMINRLFAFPLPPPAPIPITPPTPSAAQSQDPPQFQPGMNLFTCKRHTSAAAAAANGDAHYDFSSRFFFWNFLNWDWMATAAFSVSGSSMSMSKSSGTSVLEASVKTEKKALTTSRRWQSRGQSEDFIYNVLQLWTV